VTDLPARRATAAPPIDAVLVVSFGGPEGPAEVMPFLENVTRGRRVPRERLLAVAEHYYALGGVSPINGQNRDLIELLDKELAAAGRPLPVHFGNRNWAPYLEDTVAEMATAGLRHAAAYVTAAYAGYSSCRQYRQDIAAARAVVGEAAPRITKLPHFFDQPGFLQPLARHTRDALDTLPAEVRDGAHLAFTAHSVPATAAEVAGPAGGGYVGQLRQTARLVADTVGTQVGASHPWELVWQSRSGPPSQPWLEPDISDHLRALAAAGAPAVVVVPIGFVSDHVEVVHDLDDEARHTARELSLPFARAATVGTAAEFVAMIADLVRDIDEPGTAAAGLGDPALRWTDCTAGCCLA
jgi:protoporphyrin/coproporphyrin ferrochelatase